VCLGLVFWRHPDDHPQDGRGDQEADAHAEQHVKAGQVRDVARDQDLVQGKYGYQRGGKPEGRIRWLKRPLLCDALVPEQRYQQQKGIAATQ
jgi:hypothetical protein